MKAIFARVPQIKHIAGFLVSGLAAFLMDVGVTKLVGAVTGWPWGVCRAVAIPPAMLVSWLCHRHLTFAVETPANLREFARFFAMSWSTVLVNYLLFLAVLWLRPGLDAGFAIFLSSLVAMAYSYVAMRFGVFVKR
jgi:putative flippase GtrA